MRVVTKAYAVIKTGCNTEELFSSEKAANKRYDKLMKQKPMIKIGGNIWPSYYQQEREILGDFS